MPFTNPKCAKCLNKWILPKSARMAFLLKESYGHPYVRRVKCDEHCLSTEKRVNRGQHYVALNLWRHNKELNRKLFPRGREAAVEELEKKIEEVRICVNQENKS